MNPAHSADYERFALAAEKVAANYFLLLCAVRKAILYLNTTDLAYEPLERALAQIDGPEFEETNGLLGPSNASKLVRPPKHNDGRDDASQG